MSTIVLRSTNGGPLTNNQVDANFDNLNNDKYESGDSVSLADITFTGTLTLSASGAVSATGTTQGTGAVLTSMLNVVTSVTASSAEAVVLPSAAIGVAVTVVNTTATALKVFPASGDVINGGSANASITLAPYATYQFVAKDTTNWYTMDNPIVYDSSGNRLN
jgi:hypothetical protein